MSFLWSLAAFIIVIGVLVFVHEFGHFWAARKCGIFVQRFSIGFGKVLWSYTDKQGTEFAVSIIPLGGYVKMLDQQSENNAIAPDFVPQSFNQKSILQRAFVIAAGPIANFIFAVFAYLLVYSIGIPSVIPVIDEVKTNSIAAQANIQPNQQILAIDGENTFDWESIGLLLTTKMGNPKVTLTLSSFQQNQPHNIELDLSNWHFEPDKESPFSALGIVPKGNKIDGTLSKVSPDSPASKAGLQVGDKLLNTDGSPLNWHKFVADIEQGKTIELLYQRAGKQMPVSLQPELNEKNKWFVGITPSVLLIEDKYRTELKYDILPALQKALEKTESLIELTVKVLAKLFNGDLSLSNLSGPVSIAKGAGLSAEIGFVYYLSFMALISVNLGIMNLFPLPVLDGGRLVLLGVEAVAGKKLSERIQSIVSPIGAILLLMLTIFALFNDFLRL